MTHTTISRPRMAAIYAPGTVLFVLARREQGRKLFSPSELVILAISVIGAVVGVAALATGAITV